MKDNNASKPTGFLDDILRAARNVAFGAGVALAGLYAADAKAEERPESTQPAAVATTSDAITLDDATIAAYDSLEGYLGAKGKFKNGQSIIKSLTGRPQGDLAEMLGPLAVERDRLQAKGKKRSQADSKRLREVKTEINQAVKQIRNSYSRMSSDDIEGLKGELTWKCRTEAPSTEKPRGDVYCPFKEIDVVDLIIHGSPELRKLLLTNKGAMLKAAKGYLENSYLDPMNALYGNLPGFDEAKRNLASVIQRGKLGADTLENGYVLSPGNILVRDNNFGTEDVLARCVKEGTKYVVPIESGPNNERVLPARQSSPRKKLSFEGDDYCRLLIQPWDDIVIPGSEVVAAINDGRLGKRRGISTGMNIEGRVIDLSGIFTPTDQKYSVALRPLVQSAEGVYAPGETVARDDKGDWNVREGEYRLESTDMEGLDNVTGNIYVVDKKKLDQTQTVTSVVQSIIDADDQKKRIDELVASNVLMSPSAETEGINDINQQFELFEGDEQFVVYFEGTKDTTVQRSDAIVAAQEKLVKDGVYTKTVGHEQVEDAEAVPYVIPLDATGKPVAVCKSKAATGNSGAARFYIDSVVKDGVAVPLEGKKPKRIKNLLGLKSAPKKGKKNFRCMAVKGGQQSLTLGDLAKSEHTALWESLPEDVRKLVPKATIGKLVIGHVASDKKDVSTAYSRPFLTPTATKDSTVGTVIEVTYQPGESVTRGTNGGENHTEFHNLTLDGVARLDINRLNENSPVDFADLNLIYRVSNADLDIGGSDGSAEEHELWVGALAGWRDADGTYELKIGPRVLVYNQDNLNLNLPTGGKISADARDAKGFGFEGGMKLRLGDWTAEASAEYLHKIFSEYAQIPGESVEPRTDKEASELNLEGLVRFATGHPIASGVLVGVDYQMLKNAMTYRDQDGEQHTENEQHSLRLSAGGELQAPSGNYSAVIMGVIDPFKGEIGGQLDVHLLGEHLNASALTLFGYDKDSKTLIFGISGSY